ncbi:MAG: N-acetyltransferase [Desulfopila sp.]|jgi:ribosomal protein S18 acetylase RimI-like enzyme|nr:N-acetyltransferase [Desulfopila sp.]
MTKICTAAITDLDSLVEMENLLFVGDRISRRQFRYLLTKANGIVLKAEEEGRVVGYMILLKRKNSTILRVYSIGVTPSYRKRGIAGAMISYAENCGRDHGYTQLSLEVCEKNESAVQLYKNAGFCPVSIKKKYYEDGCDALHMVKTLLVEGTAA